MSRTAEFVTLSEAASRAVAGPSSRHAALIEDAFDVLLETPGGGVSLTGDVRGRASAKKVVEALALRAERGLEVAEAHAFSYTHLTLPTNGDVYVSGVART